jgi:MFS family permease
MALRRVLADVTPLRESAGFRALFTGQLVSFIGSQITVVAAAVQVFELTHRSSLAVGLLSLGQLPPLLVGSLVGGAVVDSTDRRRLLIRMQVLLALCAVGLAVNAMQDRPHVWPVFAITAVAAGLSGLDRPARSASIPGMVRPEQLAAAFALWQVQMTSGLAVGPALGGVVLSTLGTAGAFWIDAATFGVAFVACTRLPPLLPEGGGTRVSLGSIADGLRFIKGSRVLQGTFLIDINAMVFGMPRALFPALGLGVFGGGASTVGLLYAAPGTCALLGALTTGWVSRVRRQGLAVYLAVAVWGVAIAAFGLTSWLPLALTLLALAGAADVVSAVFRNTILQMSVPDALRGRLSSVHIAVVTGGPRVGDVEAGAVASLTTPRISVVSGGLACAAGVVVLAWLLPEFRRYALPPPAVVSETDG